MSLNINNLCFRYKPNQPLIENLNFHVKTGQLVAITGASGCGKSTLLQLILGFIQPVSGSIQFADRILTDDSHFVMPESRSIGIVFQDYALFPHLTVRENIGFGLRLPAKEKQSRIDKWLKLFSLADVAFSYPHQLSGGQMQRVAIARAVAPEPQLLLLDEPFSNLDPTLTARLRQDLKPIFLALNMTIVLVTHHRDDAMFLADEIYDFPLLLNSK
jgi:iron(III) transport system ATP-binding protein